MTTETETYTTEMPLAALIPGDRYRDGSEWLTIISITPADAPDRRLITAVGDGFTTVKVIRQLRSIVDVTLCNACDQPRELDQAGYCYGCSTEPEDVCGSHDAIGCPLCGNTM